MPNAHQLKQLGQLIRDARRSHEWTLKQLSEKSGVGYSYCSNIERGYVNPKRGPVTPSDDTLFALAKTLDLPTSRIHAMLGRSDDWNPVDDSRPQAELVLETIKKLLSEPEDYLRRIGEDVDMKPLYSTPLSPLRATAGDMVRGGDSGCDYDTIGDVMPHQTRGIRVTGDCMAPYYQDGDILLVRETPFAENGQKVIALVDGDALSCKVFRSSGEKYLEPVNGEGRISAERFRIIGVVATLIRDA